MLKREIISNIFIHNNYWLMKKLYIFATATLMAGALSVSANTEVVSRTFSKQVAEKSQMESATNVKPAKVTARDDDWTDIGEGSMREVFCSNLAKNLDPAEITGIKVQQNKNDKNCYRFVNPYMDYQLPFSEALMTYDATGTYYLYVNIIEKDGKQYFYFPEPFRTGLEMVYNPTGNPYGPGPVSLVMFNLEPIAADPEGYLEKAPQFFGEVKDGTFSFPSATGTYKTNSGEDKEFYHLMWNGVSSLEDGQAYILRKNNFALALPGKQLPTPPDPWDSYTLVGDATMTNYILDNIFGEYGASPSPVVVYENPMRKGELHVKNAWVDQGWNNPTVAAETDFEIDMSIPDNGYIDWQSTNYEDVQLESVVDVLSYSAFCTDYTAGTKITMAEFKEKYPASVISMNSSNLITIPLDAMVYIFPDVPETSEYYNKIAFAPEGGRTTTLQLPASYVRPSAINDIEIDNSNAPVRYFNLQGVEVANPEAGQLVIKVQGTKAVKEIVK